MAAQAREGDPRLTGETDMRPIVAPTRSDRSFGWIAAGLLAIAALMLFVVLDARRRARSAPAIAPSIVDDIGAPAPMAPLLIPPSPAVAVAPAPLPAPERETFAPAPPPLPQSQSVPRSVIMQQSFPNLPAPAAPQRRGSPDSSSLVIDTPEEDMTASASEGDATTGTSTAGATPPPSAGATTGQRVGATVMRHRATTVPQGTLIPAVLESALDSTRPGLARALVSSDVRGFDGSHVLIPRGSRLIGEYHADVQPGQNRALVTWTRLIRPDGVTIAIGSPAADPIGQIGIKGNVDSHFLSKFGAAILQSALEIGVNLASRAGSSSTTVVALPSTVQGSLSPLASSTPVLPTLRVSQGVALTVFVARDLDFTSVETVP